MPLQVKAFQGLYPAMRVLFCLVALGACGTEANHLGNPLLWPVTLPVSAVEEAVYSARRAEVSSFVAANYPALLDEIRASGGTTLSEAFDLARVPAASRAEVTARFAEDIALYEADQEALVVALMVSGP
ncbi:hypothetical protein [Dinoroseobacter sp. S76]|uniref:hypothetical protein n=1 Tax=Dinoroseobacter sp. S76 TaxID=3415124 RepID=UPI003C7A2ABB